MIDNKPDDRSKHTPIDLGCQCHCSAAVVQKSSGSPDPRVTGGLTIVHR